MSFSKEEAISYAEKSIPPCKDFVSNITSGHLLSNKVNRYWRKIEISLCSSSTDNHRYLILLSSSHWLVVMLLPHPVGAEIRVRGNDKLWSRHFKREFLFTNSLRNRGLNSLVSWMIENSESFSDREPSRYWGAIFFLSFTIWLINDMN